MQTLTFKSHEEALAVAKEALWLAWNAVGGAGGMGIFQNKPGATKEEVWTQAYDQLDYSTRHGDAGDVHADYVFGRMMKLNFRIDANKLEISENECRRDYQAWCGKYPTYAALFDAATESMGAEKSRAA